MDHEECDSCGDIIIECKPYVVSEDHHFVFSLPTGNRDEYHARDYILCTECKRQIVDWIEDCDESEVRADAVDLERLADVLAETSAELKVGARRIDAIARGEEVE